MGPLWTYSAPHCGGLKSAIGQAFEVDSPPWNALDRSIHVGGRLEIDLRSEGVLIHARFLSAA